jgi:hypothetical protein
MEFFRNLLSSNGFMPHGYCYMWKPGLVWLHVVSDSLIALAYFSIPFTLIYFIRKRRDLGNVVKHSGSDRVRVFLSVEGDQTLLRVADRGRGFDAESVQGEGGLGLVSMRERLRLVGGTLGVISSPGQGTEIEAVVRSNRDA